MTELGPDMPLLMAVIGCLTAAISGQTTLNFPASSEKLDNVHSMGNLTSHIGKKPVRLVNRTGLCSGAVQVKMSGSWQPVCEDFWSNRASLAVCRELNCVRMEPVVPTVTPAPERPEHLPVGNRSEFLNDTWGSPLPVFCDQGGWERCQVQPSACTSGRSAKVDCAEVHAVRLVDGGDRCAGRVELKDKGSWGTACDDAWDLADANVVCKQLGCGWAVEALEGSYFQKGEGPIHLDEVNCSGSELSLWECPAQRNHDCGHKEDAGVVCSGSRTFNMSLIPKTSSSPQLPTTASFVPIGMQKKELREQLLLIFCIILGILLLVSLIALTFIFLKAKGKYDSQKHRVTEDMAQQNRFRMPPLQEDAPAPAPQNYQRHSSESSTSSGEGYCNSPTSRLPRSDFPGFSSERIQSLEQPPNLELAGSRATLPDVRLLASQNCPRHNSESSTSSGEDYCNSPTSKLPRSNFPGFSSERKLLEPPPNLELAGSRATLPGSHSRVVSAGPAAEDSSSTSSGECYENFGSSQEPPTLPFMCPEPPTTAVTGSHEDDSSSEDYDDIGAS